MARTLVKAKEVYLHPNMEKRSAGNYLVGHPVVSFEDGHIFGRKETLPDFIIIDTPGVPLGALIKYQQPYEKNGKQILRRQFKFNLATVNQAIANNGALELNKTQMISRMTSRKRA